MEFYYFNLIYNLNYSILVDSCKCGQDSPPESPRAKRIHAENPCDVFAQIQ